MWNLNDVKSIEYKRDFSFLIEFDDGTGAVVDLSEYIDRGPVFAPLRDPAFFRQARIDGGTIAWPNGADIAPETLYEKCLQSARGKRAADCRKGRMARSKTRQCSGIAVKSSKNMAR